MAPSGKTQHHKRIEFLLQRHSLNDDSQRQLLEDLAKLDPTINKKYLAWILKHYRAGWRGTMPQRERIFNNLKRFEELKQFGGKKAFVLGLKLKGYDPDIFEFDPQTLAQLIRKTCSTLAAEKERRRIVKGELVLCSGAEIAYQDQRFTVVRIRSESALLKLSRAGRWCTRNSIYFSPWDDESEYELPFDLVFEKGRAQYLVNKPEVKDRFNRGLSDSSRQEILAITRRACDGFDQAEWQVNRAIKNKQRLSEENERRLIAYPGFATRYAVFVLRRPWPAFEQEVKLNRISPYCAVDYAIKAKRGRWQRAEKVIFRTKGSLRQYSEFFGLPLPPTIAVGKRQRMVELAVSNDRDRDLERELASKPRLQSDYLRTVAGMASNRVTDAQRIKVRSFFVAPRNQEPWEFVQALRLIGLLSSRVYCLEPLISKDPTWSLEYAIKVTRRRFKAGEVSITACPNAAVTYAVHVIKDRWFVAEPGIRQDSSAWAAYSRAFRVPF